MTAARSMRSHAAGPKMRQCSMWSFGDASVDCGRHSATQSQQPQATTSPINHSNERGYNLFKPITQDELHLGMPFAFHANMLLIASKPLSRSELVYAAFRTALLDTRERLSLVQQLDMQPDASFGFLTEVPFLRNVPAHVQLDLLADTWRKHLSDKVFSANLLDESILYSVCETAARMVRTEPQVVQRFLRQGPVPFLSKVNADYADKLQRLHVDFENPGNFLLISQFQDVPPEEATPLKKKYGIHPHDADCMFDALSRWYINPSLLDRVKELLTSAEQMQMQPLFERTACK